jgi:hypothetical protein
VAALVELVWGAASFTGEGCMPKVSAVPCNEEEHLSTCAPQGRKLEATKTQERGTLTRRGGSVASPSQQYVRSVQAGQRRR